MLNFNTQDAEQECEGVKEPHFQQIAKPPLSFISEVPMSLNIWLHLFNAP